VHKIPRDCKTIVGDALTCSTYVEAVRSSDTFIHLVGVAHPGPAKADQFRNVDLVAAREAINAATQMDIRHFIYLSVAQPAPVMKAYVQVRAECEKVVRASELNATILRPWYVLGPEHRWPYLLLPFYWACERIPATRDSARRLGLVSLKQMVCALVAAVENPIKGIKIVDVPGIRVASPS